MNWHRSARALLADLAALLIANPPTIASARPELSSVHAALRSALAAGDVPGIREAMRQAERTLDRLAPTDPTLPPAGDGTPVPFGNPAA